MLTRALDRIGHLSDIQSDVYSTDAISGVVLDARFWRRNPIHTLAPDASREIPAPRQPPGIEPGFPVCRTGVFLLDHGPVSGPPGSRTPITWVQTKRPPIERAAHVFERSVRESNPVPLLTTQVFCRNTYRPSSDPGWNRTITFLGVIQASSPLDHGIMSVTEAGVEPAKSRGSRPRRFACLRTRPLRAGCQQPVWESNPTCSA